MATSMREPCHHNQETYVPPKGGTRNLVPKDGARSVVSIEEGTRNAAFPDLTQAERPINRGDITRLLTAWGQGDQKALDNVLPLAFEDLRRIARRCCGRLPCHDLQPTELIGEIYGTLLKQKNIHMECRGQFFLFAGLLMERTLLDLRRQLLTRKRGGDMIRIPSEALSRFDNDWALSSGQPLFASGSADTQDTIGTAIDVAETIAELAKLDSKQAETARLRCLLGLTAKETAETLGVSLTTAKRKWRNAKRFLALKLDTYAPH